MRSAVVARLLVLFVVIMVVISLVLTSVPGPLQ